MNIAIRLIRQRKMEINGDLRDLALGMTNGELGKQDLDVGNLKWGSLASDIEIG